MRYRSVADMNAVIRDSLWRLPRDIEIVVGVPRSGLLPATLIALYRHLPLADLDGLLAGRVFGHGPRLQAPAVAIAPGNGRRRVLIVDDSTATGAEMQRVRQRLEKARIDIDPLCLAVFATPESTDRVDFYFDVVPGPRVFEWNLFNAWSMPETCVDIDGVLCRDPTEAENDDGERYLAFLTTVEPKIRIGKEIGHIVTSRLEKYRDETESWLRRSGFRYKKLHMMTYATAAERRAANQYGAFKAQIYIDSFAPLFIESSYPLAIEIARRAMKPVFCTDMMKMVYPGEDEDSFLTPVRDAFHWRYRSAVNRGRRKLSRGMRTLAFRLMKTAS